MPLHSIRVLDLSRLLPGPFCTMILADFGAEVIKIEEPKLGDYARFYEPKVDEYGAMFHSLNRNKKSVTLNLKDEEGKQKFLQLVKDADVLVESFRPGVMERLGLNYEILKELNPRLIYCAITGYGQTGPYAKLPGHDINFISYTGLLHLMGERDGKPLVPAVQVGDIGGGAYPAVVGILLALQEREKSGEGQFVDISMLDGVLSWLQATLPNYLMSGEEVQRGEQMLSGSLACYEVYQTKDRRWLSVGALEPKFWQTFCETIGKLDFIEKLNAPIDEQYRMKHEIQSIIFTKNLDEWMELFKNVEACVSPVLDFSEVVEHPQVQAREMILEKHNQKYIGIPIKLSRTPGAIKTKAPNLGEHNDEFFKNE
ncbi:CaiB/BaiF CoA transferase family protein [Pallidibacillus pasinlerensis]|uniref:CoA transferase n=1 Tax=Pallidibacillus pasinlerensis TaxID=2703818 RepID=A0ABX0A341_9BACI|nr:CoA transferase [Pallidibacillus pasinlerensis]NCU17853.1 CoA transferase [Pallidibacillus pasinlerensis]